MLNYCNFYRQIGKRAIDLLLVIPAILCSSPLIAALWFLVGWKLGAPVLFCQFRPGLNGVPFKMYKFRTMSDRKGDDGELLPDSQRLTTLGKFLRNSSLDELPELFNVLLGEMSLVGPRPLLMRYLPHYSKNQARRHEVKPGITGWAQVNGRNALSWERKFEMDLWYVENLSLIVDCKILGRTLVKVFLKEGIEFTQPESMPYFLGSSGDSVDANDKQTAESDGRLYPPN